MTEPEPTDWNRALCIRDEQLIVMATDDERYPGTAKVDTRRWMEILAKQLGTGRWPKVEVLDVPNRGEIAVLRQQLAANYAADPEGEHIVFQITVVCAGPRAMARPYCFAPVAEALLCLGWCKSMTTLTTVYAVTASNVEGTEPAVLIEIADEDTIDDTDVDPGEQLAAVLEEVRGQRSEIRALTARMQAVERGSQELIERIRIPPHQGLTE